MTVDRIPPATVAAQVQRDIAVDPFAPDFFQKFFSQGLVSAQTRNLNSDPITLSAESLPAEGKPADFSGAVGRFSIAAALDNPKTKAGEAVFAGKGACIACHKAGKIGASPVGPDLTQIAKIQTPDYIMKKILDPAGMGTVSGYPKGVMPPTLGQTLTAKEYMDLMAFLLTLK
jgi:mono/diheme cytochrome c family protein